MSENEIEFEEIASSSQLGDPPALRWEKVDLPEWKTRSGKGTRVYAYELTAAEHAEYAVSDRVFDELGQTTRFKTTGDELRFLGYTIRTRDGHRIWRTLADAEAELGRRGKHSINKLVLAARRMNYGDEDTKSADEAVASAEGNSEETPTAA